MLDYEYLDKQIKKIGEDLRSAKAYQRDFYQEGDDLFYTEEELEKVYVARYFEIKYVINNMNAYINNYARELLAATKQL